MLDLFFASLIIIPMLLGLFMFGIAIILEN